jgi:Xaa-Pro aminopeptidase
MSASTVHLRGDAWAVDVVPPPVPSFPPEEFQRRIDGARRAMEAHGIACLLVTGEQNFRYFTGDITPSPFQLTRPKFFLLPLVGDPCAIVAQAFEPGLRLTTWLADIRTWPAPRPEDDGVSLVADALRAFATGRGAVGAELGPESRIGFPAGDFLRLRDMVTPLSFVDAEVPVLRRLRMIKSPAEIANVRTVCHAVSAAYQALPGFLEMGDTEWTACHKLGMEILRRGATSTTKITGISGAHGYERSSVGPTDRRLGPGDLLSIDTGCQYAYYWCDFCRHYAFGSVSDATRRAHDALYRATDAGLAAVRPGRRMSDVWRAMAAVIERDGFDVSSKVGRMGHGMGLGMPEPPSINAVDDTLIEPGMILNIEPSLAYLAPEDGRRKIMLHEENIAVTEQGYELLTWRAPAEIPVVV